VAQRIDISLVSVILDAMTHGFRYEGDRPKQTERDPFVSLTLETTFEQASKVFFVPTSILGGGQ
jgi:hypothetical protein